MAIGPRAGLGIFGSGAAGTGLVGEAERGQEDGDVHMDAFSLYHRLGMVILVLASFGIAYSFVATWATLRFLGRRGRASIRQPSVSVLKPLHGLEPELYENLSSFCAQDYGGPVQIILGAHDPEDPALAVAARVKAEHPELQIDIVADRTLHGVNRKVCNLINMAPYAAGEVIVISDSDVCMAPGGLEQIVATLEEPGVGLIYCVYRGRPTMSGWSHLAAMDVNLRFTPSALVGAAFGAPVCLGPTMALRADLLKAIGGFETFADVLADDFELGRAVRAGGHRVTCPPLIIEHLFPDGSASEMLVHELRWARTVRLVEPVGYVGAVITHVLPLSLIGAAFMGFSRPSLMFFGAVLALRLMQALVFSRLLSTDWRLLWLVPLRDLLSFGVFLAGLFGERVEWRGRRLRVASNGAIAAW
jgi:ceramide glucosyltransferase